MELKNLVGQHVLSGIETGTRKVRSYWGEETINYVKFILDGVTYLADEDPSDGYRSYMEELQVVNERCRIPLPDIAVLCRMREDSKWERNDVLEFLDAVNGKVILAIGTQNWDDYYPYCVLEYTPENMSCNERE